MRTNMREKPCHEVCFRDVSNDWDSALPIGNGRFGAMVFVKDHVLHIALNHYDCYYHVLPRLHNGKGANDQTFQDPARFVETYEELCRKADEVRLQPDAPRSHYARTLHPASAEGRPSYRGASYPLGGELLIPLDEKVDMGCSCLKLLIEEALITFEAGTGEACVTARILAAQDQDGLLLQLSQTREGLWQNGSIVIPPAVGGKPCRVENTASGGGLCMRAIYDAASAKEEQGFIQEVVFCREDGEKTSVSPFMAAVSLQPGTGKAQAVVRSLLKEAESHIRIHRSYWQQFWSGRVRLPDAFLERLWYLQLYLLECSCGRGSAYPEQACGLSGLWDIRRPNMWGSMWYWDVNIQSTFWGCGSAGHPEILKLFCDGYLAYEQDIREYTRLVYGWDGWALDYPHPLYHSIQPWCAQFLWQYYQYSGDREFLEQKAYPVFLEQIAFFRKLSVKDDQGIRHVRYDISPEQGPVTMDSVITISCIRKLIVMAAEAGKILGRPEPEREELELLYKELPPYPLTADGSRYKDSLLVQDNIFLRHPSVLMPLFPAGEIGLKLDMGAKKTSQAPAGAAGDQQTVRMPDTGDQELARWERTLQHAAMHTETGTFGMGWLAAAAARLGRGRTALRLIYENGLDYILHTNGLAYEESEGFLNYCHLTKPAHYLPVMMETSGGLVNAVNEMLLQTGKEGELLIFPAVPDETPDLLPRIVQYREDDAAVEGQYGCWTDVSFAGLLAPGGFRVSAKRKDGVTVFLKVESSREAVLKLVLPGELAENGQTCMLERRMKAGEAVFWGQEEDLETSDIEQSDEQTVRRKGQDQDRGLCTNGAAPQTQEILCHVAARTHRRIFLGADRHTSYYKAVDGFTCGYLLANDYRYVQTPYIFDFGTCGGDKDYDNSYPRQFAMAGQCVLYGAGPIRTGAQEYQARTGYGFLQCQGIRAADRGKPDDLRRDLLEGDREAVFVLSLPKGKYDLLLVCGDEKEASFTKLYLPDHGTAVCTGKLAAGEYGCKILPVVQEQDAELRIGIAPGQGCRWKLNAMFVNKEYGL